MTVSPMPPNVPPAPESADSKPHANVAHVHLRLVILLSAAGHLSQSAPGTCIVRPIASAGFSASAACQPACSDDCFAVPFLVAARHLIEVCDRRVGVSVLRSELLAMAIGTRRGPVRPACGLGVFQP